MNINEQGQITNKSWINSVPGILRILGILSLIGCAVVALIQGMKTEMTLITIFSFFGIIATLFGVGCVTQNKLKADAGSDTMIGASIALIPPFSALLGAVLIGTFPFINFYSTYWQITSAISAEALSLTIGATAIASSVITYYGLMRLSLNRTVLLTGIILSGFFILLTPDRSNTLMSVFAVILSGLAIIGSKLEHESHTLQKPTSIKWVDISLWLPVVILIIRTYGASNIDSIANGVMLITFGSMIITLPNRIWNNNPVTELTEWLGAGILLAGAYILSGELVPNVIEYAPLKGLIISCVIFMGGLIATHTKGIFNRLAALVLFLFSLTAPFTRDHIHPSLTVMALGVCMTFFSIRIRQQYLLLFGSIMTLFSVIGLMSIVFGQISISHWTALGVGGIVILLLSTVLEQRLKYFIEYTQSAYKKVRSW